VWGSRCVCQCDCVRACVHADVMGVRRHSETLKCDDINIIRINLLLKRVMESSFGSF
jgi:hypothetical protein